ncbi:hypothetical protein FDI24_gp167 [Acidovorax phage ACP17]|uniref:Uncharacterized protein n=1 Tax=Acidovorax phage ACP17 TaxID=2010329 RepID=A0A218M323_9CAUD|nr:hypothetical protein FDI24_gp167 [Acidovorax phage ACP17]ASD50449.1 hypothetical protein [Acidovorax phage ACP17]
MKHYTLTLITPVRHDTIPDFVPVVKELRNLTGWTLEKSVYFLRGERARVVTHQCVNLAIPEGSRLRDIIRVEEGSIGKGFAALSLYELTRFFDRLEQAGLNHDMGKHIAQLQEFFNQP